MPRLRKLPLRIAAILSTGAGAQDLGGGEQTAQ